MSEVMIPQLINVSTKKQNFLVEYVKYHAKYGNKDIVKNARNQSKNTKLISFKDSVDISLLSMYGVIRPTVRKIYYTVCRRVKTA